jgi:uncharacterized protein (TIGR00255 family)
MLKSMTGFGNSVVETIDYTIKAEIRSLNSKSLDLKIKLPPKFCDKEIELQSYLEKRIERGKVDLYIQLTFLNVNQLKKSLNPELFKAYYTEINDICKELQIETANLVSTILNLPDVISSNNNMDEGLEAIWQNILKAVDQTVTEMEKFRIREGAELANVISQYIRNIDNKLKIVEAGKENRITKVKERLKQKLASLENVKIDENRLEQELIYFLEKLDISEEIERLKTHLNHFLTTMKEDNPGRKLGFITQESGREINTIGSKANEFEIQKHVVEMKDELEKIKQQLANII